MPTVRASHTLHDLASDMQKIARRAPRDEAKVVRDNAREGNRIAKAFASEQHTMFGDEDVEYPPSFTAEKIDPTTWEYGPDASIGDGSQASGYEFGSINSPPHFDLARSVEAIRPEFHLDVEDMITDWFWSNT